MRAHSRLVVAQLAIETDDRAAGQRSEHSDCEVDLVEVGHLFAPSNCRSDGLSYPGPND
jgi:hypothetical protein